MPRYPGGLPRAWRTTTGGETPCTEPWLSDPTTALCDAERPSRSAAGSAERPELSRPRHLMTARGRAGLPSADVSPTPDGIVRRGSSAVPPRQFGSAALGSRHSGSSVRGSSAVRHFPSRQFGGCPGGRARWRSGTLTVRQFATPALPAPELRRCRPTVRRTGTQPKECGVGVTNADAARATTEDRRAGRSGRGARQRPRFDVPCLSAAAQQRITEDKRGDSDKRGC